MAAGQIVLVVVCLTAGVSAYNYTRGNSPCNATQVMNFTNRLCFESQNVSLDKLQVAVVCLWRGLLSWAEFFFSSNNSHSCELLWLLITGTSIYLVYLIPSSYVAAESASEAPGSVTKSLTVRMEATNLDVTAHHTRLGTRPYD